MGHLHYFSKIQFLIYDIKILISTHIHLLFKYILLIMLLQLSQFFLLCPALPSTLIPSIYLHLSSCPWVMHISSFASPFPILYFASPVYLVPTNLYVLIPACFPPFSSSRLITLQMISTSTILFLYYLFT